MKRFEPVQDSPVTDAFWEATRHRQLLIQWCDACDRPVWFPREVCPGCLLSTSLEWRASPGAGKVYAISWQYGGDEPYAVALVELDEGVRMMSNVVGAAPESVPVGARVQLTWEALSDGRHLPLFERSHEGDVQS